MAGQKIYEFTVEGRGSFPLDMLRYDRCWPRSEAQVATLDRETHSRGDGLAYAVQLQGLSEPTVARWESFGWRVWNGGS